MNQKFMTVAVSGAFDPMHAGHIRYIHEAARLGDRLVVILNSDNFVMKKKGFVFWPFNERKEILENIKGVDEVVAAIDEDQTVRKTLEMIKPDIFAKGGYAINPEHVPEADTCREIGCQLVTNVGGSPIHVENDKSQKGEKPAKMKIACPYCADHPILRTKCLYCHGKGKIEVNKA
jgi:cytidyltransferase-like protein